MIMVKDPRSVDCRPNIFCGLSASPSLSARVALRRCANESFNACTTRGLVVGKGHDCFEIQAVGRRRPQCTGNAIVRADNVGEDFTYRANALGGTPGVFFRRHSL